MPSSEGGIPPLLSDTAPAAFSLTFLPSTPPAAAAAAADEDLLTEEDAATATVVVLLLLGVFTFLVLRNCGRISTLS